MLLQIENQQINEYEIKNILLFRCIAEVQDVFYVQDLEMQKRTVKDMEFDYNIAKEQLAIKEKLIRVRKDF